MGGKRPSNRMSTTLPRTATTTPGFAALVLSFMAARSGVPAGRVLGELQYCHSRAPSGSLDRQWRAGSVGADEGTVHPGCPFDLDAGQARATRRRAISGCAVPGSQASIVGPTAQGKARAPTHPVGSPVL